MIQIGIWIDAEKAFLIFLDNKEMSLETVLCIKQYAKEKALVAVDQLFEESIFYAKVIKSVGKVDTIVLFGEGDTPFKFEKAVKELDSVMHLKIKSVLNIAEMSKEQFGVLVKDFYTLSSKARLIAENSVGF